ncbi:MAG: 23S rRNA (cytidine1920-2'-O)/16S rRNA (cytidine1409-2'-O)-methyltransferase [Psychromonas sp.]|jgi:23S rRNA (cytidine1920-2'-O)/16S rRNA (cytidine1409-2'-O)-methyltransferase
MEERLDKLLLELGLVSTRVRAEELIKVHGVMVNGKMVNKPGKKFDKEVKIQMLAEEIPYVSRGALKLKKAIEEFKVEVKNKICLDIGASTGGFTEILIENGAQKVYCVDVGHGQLHDKIKDDERIVNLEKTHVRELTSTIIDQKCSVCVIDVSFISLEKIFPFVQPLLDSNADCIVLVKPQFEVGKENIGKGGIVKNRSLYPTVIQKIKKIANNNNLSYKAHIESPILGGDGNLEFLMWLTKV